MRPFFYENNKGLRFIQLDFQCFLSLFKSCKRAFFFIYKRHVMMNSQKVKNLARTVALTPNADYIISADVCGTIHIWTKA
jgi:hypothetical protein